MTRAPQLSGRRHIFVTKCVTKKPGSKQKQEMRGQTKAQVENRSFHAPISKACRDTLPSDHRFCSSTWSNFRTNRIETTTNSRDISAQTTALLLSTVSIALATRSKSLTLLPVAPVRWTSWARISSLRSQANISPSLSSMHLGTPAATYCLATHNHLL